MRAIKIFCSSLPALLLAGTHLCFSQTTAAKLAALMKTYHDYNMFDGAVLVADQGKIVYQDAFGMANREWNIPNRTDTRFMLIHFQAADRHPGADPGTKGLPPPRQHD